MEGFREAVEQVVEEFNRLHGAEAQVRVLEFTEGGFRAEFRGSFCLTCGFYDYFDDLAYLLRERGYTVEVSMIEEVEGGAVVEYRLAREYRRPQPRGAVLILEWRRGA